MLSQLKNSKKGNQMSMHQHQLSPNLISNLSVFSPPQFPHQQKSLSRTQPITMSKSSTSKNHKKSASTTKYNLTKKESDQSQHPAKQSHIILQNEDVVKIIEQSQNLIKNNELIEGINLLKAMKDPSINFINTELKMVVLMNLAVAYYQTGFLEEAFDQFSSLSDSLSHLANIASSAGKHMKRSLYMTLQGKVQLQICILFSEMGKHQEALKHARKSCKINFELIYDILNLLCKDHLVKNKQNSKDQSSPESLKEKNLLNNIILLEHLHKLIGDLNQIFHVPEKIKLSKELLQEVRLSVSQYKSLKVDMQLLFDQDLEDKTPPKLDWIFSNKILDQIQLKSLSADFFDTEFSITNAQIVEKITYLAISFYCYSTQIRFIEKTKQDNDQGEVMDSEHWLSRSLQIAYSFMPPNAPILNQILTVHDRFHGIDKQTIPEDKEICGYFKVLKPLSKPKSVYSSKSHMCSPIMIRIQAPKITIDIKSSDENQGQQNQQINRRVSDEQKSKILDIQALTKNNKIKGLNTRIKILEFNDIKPIDHEKLTKKTHHHDASKITSRSTISDLSSLETQREKKNRINKIYHVNRRTISDKYNDFRQEPKSMTQLEGKAIISQDLLHRPLSYDKGINKWEKIEATAKVYTTQNTKRRKSLPAKNKEKLEKIVYNGSVKFDGLKLTGKKLNETFEIDSSFLEKLTQAHNNEQSLIESARTMGRNIFINNNINLYISKGKQQPQTSRQASLLKQEISKRQKFISKRRLSHLNIYPTEQFQMV